MKKIVAILLSAALLCTAAAIAIASPTKDSVSVHLEGFVAGDANGLHSDHWIGFSADNTTEFDSYTGFPATYGAAYYNGNIYGYVYGYDSESVLHDDFYVMDAATHFISYPEGASSEGEFVYGMAYNYADNKMYAICDDNKPYLATVNLETGALTKTVDIDLGSYLGIQCFTIDNSGNFYGLTFAAISSKLVRLNPATGSVTEIMSTDLPCFYAQSMAWDAATNAIYWAQVDSQTSSSNGLYRIDVASQSVSYLGQIGNNFEITGLVVIPDYVEPEPTAEPTVAPTAEPTQPADKLPGDINVDGSVDFADVSCLYMYLMGTFEATAQGVINADFNGDGSVDFSDVSELYMSLIAGDIK